MTDKKQSQKKVRKQPLIPNFTVLATPVRVDLVPKPTFEEMKNEVVKKAESLLSNKSKSENENNSDQQTKSSLKRKYNKYEESERKAVLDLLPFMTPTQVEDKFGIKASTIRGWRDKPSLKDGRETNGRKAVLGCLESKLLEILK